MTEPVLLRTTYQGPTERGSGAVREARIVVERKNYDNWTRRSYRYEDLPGPDRHAAAVDRYLADNVGTGRTVRMTGIDARERQLWEAKA